MSLVLAFPYIEDTHIYGRPTLEAADMIAEKTIGCKLAFSSEKQVVLKTAR